MKRDILCPACGGPKSALQSKASKIAGEHIEIKYGTAKADMICDLCGKDVPAGSPCTARSIWTDQRGDYYPWESALVQEGMTK